MGLRGFRGWLAAILLVYPSICSACGMVTHSVIAHRAMEQYFHPVHYPEYRTIALRYPAAVLAGAPFPDYLYACGPNHEHGEDAHWSPFQAAAAQYIRDTFHGASNGTSEEGERLIAFMMGVVSHSVADVLWHGLRIYRGYGLIETIGGFDYNGTGGLDSIPHTMADTGGEFRAAREIDLSFLAPFEWDVPTQHIVNIFARLNDTVNPNDILKCQIMFAAGTDAIKHLGSAITDAETDASPLFQEEYLHMPLGGIDDMAMWTARMWERFADWIVNGPPSQLPPFLSSAPRPSTSLTELYKDLGSRLIEARARAGSSVETRSELQGDSETESEAWCMFYRSLEHELATNPNTGVASSLSNVGIDALRIAHLASRRCDGLSLPPPEISAVPQALPVDRVQQGVDVYGYFGSSLAVGDLNNDTTVDVFVGVPGASAGVTVPQAGKVVGLNSNSTLVAGQGVFGRLGASLAVGDINCDGVDDLVVGAPLAGWDWDNITETANLTYRGSVLVFFGKSGAINFAEPDMVVQGDTLQFNGATLSTGDLNNDGCADIIIGSPFAVHPAIGSQTGRVDVFFGLATPRTIRSSRAANITLYGSSQYHRFGHSVAVTASGLLAVGAPGARCLAGCCPSDQVHGSGAGEVLGFRLPGTTPIFKVSGTSWKGKLGATLATGSVGGEDIIYVAATTTLRYGTNETFGVVTALQADRLAGNYSLSSAPQRFSLKSEALGSRFGHSIISTPEYLVIGAPMWSLPLVRAETGAVWVFGNVNDLEGDVDGCEGKALHKVWGEEHAERLGMAMAYIESSQHLVVSSPRANKTVMTGKVSWVHLP